MDHNMKKDPNLNVYLAGPMRGIPHFNFPAFHESAATLRKLGYTVFSPAERDLKAHGDAFVAHNLTGSIEQAEKEEGFSLRTALGDDLAWICSTADMVAVLPNWEESAGVLAELATAKALGLDIWYLD